VIRSRDGQVPSHQQADRVPSRPRIGLAFGVCHCHGWPPLHPQHAAGPGPIQLTNRRIGWQ